MDEHRIHNPIVKILKSDNYIVGIVVGLLIPLISYTLFYVLYFYLFAPHGYNLNRPEILRIIAIALNFIPIRYYFVNLKYDKTGQSVLAITVFMTFLHFYNRW